MDLITLIQIIIRRWYVTVPILLATIGIATYIQSVIPPQYEARGSVMLEEPRFDPSRLPSSFVNANAIVDRFDEEDAGADVAAGGTQIVPRAREDSTLELTVVGSDPNEVVATVETAIEWTVSAVTAIQDENDVADEERIQASRLTPVIIPEEQAEGNFEAVGAVLLRDPASGADNPFGAGGGTTSLLQAISTSDAGRIRILEATGPGVDYGVSTSRDNATIITITTVGVDPQAVVAAFDVIRDALAEELDVRQERANVLASQRIVVTDLAPPQAATNVSPPLSRAVAAIVAVGGLLALSIAVALDNILTRRRRKAQATTISSVPSRWLEHHDRVGDLDRERSIAPETVSSATDERR